MNTILSVFNYLANGLGEDNLKVIFFLQLSAALFNNSFEFLGFLRAMPVCPGQVELLALCGHWCQPFIPFILPSSALARALAWLS